MQNVSGGHFSLKIQVLFLFIKNKKIKKIKKNLLRDLHSGCLHYVGSKVILPNTVNLFFIIVIIIFK